MKRWRKFFWRAAMLSAALAAMTPRAGFAQAPTLSEIASYRDADRAQRLQQGARQEAELTLYTSMAPADIGELIATFQKTYGVKVNTWRAGSDMVLERVLAESRVNRISADVLLIDATAIEPMQQERILQRVESPGIADLLPQAVPAHRGWIPVYLNGFVQAYNTNAIKKENLPRSWRDLTKPEWKGKLGVEAKDYDWFAEVVLALGEKEGMDVFREIVTRNGVSVRVGHTLLTNLVVSGEVPMGLTPYDYSVEQRKVAGAPVDWMLIPPAIAKPSGVGVIRTAKHPNAAVLFLDFAIGDGQDLLAKRKFTTVTNRIHPPFLKGEVKIVDTALMLGRAEKWAELYKKTLLEQAR